MISIHSWKAIEKAQSMGAYAGDPLAGPLWEMSKRELVEIALRFAERLADECTVESAVEAVKEERETLRAQKII